MTPNDRIEEHQQQIDLLITDTAKHHAILEALSRLAEKQSTRTDGHDDRLHALDARLEAMAANAERQDARINALIGVAEIHDRRTAALMAAAEIHERHLSEIGLKIEQNSDQIAALTKDIADLDKRWQAYINTLPRQ